MRLNRPYPCPFQLTRQRTGANQTEEKRLHNQPPITLTSHAWSPTILSFGMIKLKFLTSLKPISSLFIIHLKNKDNEEKGPLEHYLKTSTVIDKLLRF